MSSPETLDFKCRRQMKVHHSLKTKSTYCGSGLYREQLHRADELPEVDPKSWWSYQQIRRPPVPSIPDENWCHNEIDRFVAAARTARGFPHVAEATREVWLRRVFLDLTGLPPTRQEQQRFLSDESPSAYEVVVDELLSRPQYGERWGRHWMDIWRYSDWYGSRGINEIRYSQRHIWRWRDWIVSSLNDDRGYDQMIREMLAADEIAGDDPGVLPATGFLGRNWYKFDRNAWLFETVERTGEAFLGLTFRCCRCHDHKFDPISQKEYYRFRAFFEPHDVRIDPVSALTETQKDATLGQVLNDGIASVYDRTPNAPTYRFERGDGRYPDKSVLLIPGVPAALGGSVSVQTVDLPVEAWYPMLRPGVRESIIVKADAVVSAAAKKLCEARSTVEAVNAPQQQKTAEPTIDQEKQRQGAEHAVAVAEAEFKLAECQAVWTGNRLRADVEAYIRHNTQVAVRYDRAARAEKLKRDVLSARLDVLKVVKGTEEEREAAEIRLNAAVEAANNPAAQSEAAPIGKQYPETSTGRRRALAEWIVSGENPRTARVAANHIWNRHFGQPLVATTENFGLNGHKPTHPRLLDWLASELIACGWKMKPLHRQLVLSATYRMATAATSGSPDEFARAAQLDGNNRFLRRMNSRNMEAELVRDSALYLADRLDMTIGGSEIPETDGEKTLRRSLYFRNTPNEKMLMLEVFDVADPNACYRRKESIVPAQSLAMMNSGLIQDTARILARQLSGEHDFVSAAFETVLARNPTTSESKRCREFLQTHAERFLQDPGPVFQEGGTATLAPATDPVVRAKENLIHVLFLHNDFVTIR